MRTAFSLVLVLAAVLATGAAIAPAPTYQAYLEAHADAAEPTGEVTVPGDSYSRGGVGVTTARGIGGFAGPVAVTSETGTITWPVDVPVGGMYSIELTYYALPGRGATIERELRINGELPFEDAAYLTLSRVWVDGGPIRRDVDGNEIRARQVEAPKWQVRSLSDSQGYESSPYKFLLAKGRNTISLVSLSEPVAVRSLRLYHADPPRPWKEVVEEARGRGWREARGVSITLEERQLAAKSEPTLYPVFDQGDSSASPYDPALIRLNAVGGTLWHNPGEWIAWEFEVPADGLYLLAVKAKQNTIQTLYASRRLLIDGAVPFAEAEAIRFPYSSTYRMYILGPAGGGDPYLVPLSRGRHEIRLEAVLGDLGDILRDANEVVIALNTDYRRIIIVTSPLPDPLRTYELGRRIPTVIEDLGRQRERILDIADRLESRTGQQGGHAAALRRVARLLERMQDDPDLIPGLLSELTSAIDTVSGSAFDTKRQGLLVDSVTIASPDRPPPPVRSGLGRVLVHEVRAFLASFTHDYSRIGSMEGPAARAPRKIKVWLGSGRNQAQILKGIIEDSFTPQTGIQVDLQLVESLAQTLRDNVMANLLIPAIIADRAPDVALGAANMDLAFRGAVVDLAQFPDFPEVAKRFKKSAFVPFLFRDAVYALPEIQVFPVLFYRTDILRELGLEVPQTWDDVYRLLPVLQRYHLNFGLYPDMGAFLMLLYQKGVPFYQEDCVATNLLAEPVMETFRQLTDLYTLYGLPMEYYASWYFWLGSMPLVVADYTMYNVLSEYAPELRGQWGIAPVPGTRQADGTINRAVSITTAIAPPGSLTSSSGASGAMILEQSRDKAAAWEFLKWWTSADAQERFGRELESLMGARARYTTANVEALQRLPWRAEQRRVLLEQWDWTEGLPAVPGAYYVTRMYEYLRRAVLIRNEPVRESVLRYDRLINEEITRKRVEFGLPTSLAAVEQRWKDAYWRQYSHLSRPAGGAP